MVANPTLSFLYTTFSSRLSILQPIHFSSLEYRQSVQEEEWTVLNK